VRFAILIFLLLYAAPALAWDVEGHRIIARVAELRMSKETNAVISELLDGAKLSDQKIAAWPDQIRSERPETKPWHYVNVPKEEKTYDPKRDCPDGACVTEKILPLLVIAKDASRPRRERAEAVMLASHLVADLHQPLHVGYRSDRGGNTIEVQIGTSTISDSFHAIWDTDVVDAARGKRTIEAFSADLSRSGKETGPVDAAKIASWATESHLRVADLYKDLPKSEGVLALPRSYPASQRARTEEQLKKAGLRLALLLESTFSRAKQP
jgi:nuclease S1